MHTPKSPASASPSITRVHPDIAQQARRALTRRIAVPRAGTSGRPRHHSPPFLAAGITPGSWCIHPSAAARFASPYTRRHCGRNPILPCPILLTSTRMVTPAPLSECDRSAGRHDISSSDELYTAPLRRDSPHASAPGPLTAFDTTYRRPAIDRLPRSVRRWLVLLGPSPRAIVTIAAGGLPTHCVADGQLHDVSVSGEQGGVVDVDVCSQPARLTTQCSRAALIAAISQRRCSCRRTMRRCIDRGRAGLCGGMNGASRLATAG